MLEKVRAVIEALSHWDKLGRPSYRWLFKTSTKLDQQFAVDHADDLRRVTQDGDFQYITVANETYVWPRDVPLKGLVQVLSELILKDHPHHYDVSPTLVSSGDRVLDIGSCEGSFAAYAEQKGAHAVIIEPSRTMGAVIARLFEIRRLDPPKIVSCLLGEKEQQAHFLDDRENPGASRVAPESNDTYPIGVVTLDQFVALHMPEGLDYIKCDAEGWDPKILKSGHGALTKFRPKIAVTTYHNRDDYAEIEAFLTPLGYKCSGKGLLYSDGALRTMVLHAVPANP